VLSTCRADKSDGYGFAQMSPNPHRSAT